MKSMHYNIVLLCIKINFTIIRGGAVFMGLTHRLGMNLQLLLSGQNLTHVQYLECIGHIHGG